MKKTVRTIQLMIFTIVMITVLYSCKSDNEKTKNTNDSLAGNTENVIPEVKMGNFYGDNSNKNNSVVLADTIITYTVIKNPDPSDDWQEKCLSRLNRVALANIVFNAIYNGKLTPYDYLTDEPITIEQVKEIEKNHPRSEIAKMEFSEEWYFNENDLSFSKKVNSIMMGYEGRNTEGEVKYYPGVKVFLNGAKKKIEVKDSK
jgi:hypothetical protein